MRSNETSSRRHVALASFRHAAFRTVAVVALGAMSGAAGAQLTDDDQRPYGSPFSSTGRNATQQKQQATVNQGVDPISGSANDKIEPVEVYDRSPVKPTTSGASAEAPLVKPPAKPNEFETFVERATGRKLPRFGSDLLIPGNRDFAVPATATVPPDYILNVGDIVSISLTGSTEGSVEREIDTDGKIFLPRVGAFRVVGTRYADLKQVVANAVGQQYRGYDVAVSVRQLRGIRVYVTGFANNPGAFTVNSLSTMANAVLAAGGPASGGSFRSIQLYRRGRLVSDFDLYDLLLRGDHRKDVVLQNEDTLVIPPVGEQVAIIGSVNAEAIYETKPGESAATVLGYAGGVNSLADKSRVIVYKLADRDTTGSREVPIGQLASLPASGGDLFQILSEGTLQQSIVRQSAVVRIEGEVNKPGNYYVPAGTSIAQVMEMAGGTTARAYVFGARVERASVRRQQSDGFKEAIQQLELTLAAAPLTGGGALDAATRDAQLAGARAFLDRLREAQPDGRVVLDLDPAAAALPGNLIVENNDRILIPPRASTIGVFGAVYRPASFLLPDGKPMRVRDYVAQAGGPIRAADRGNLFVIRANGSVVPRSKGALDARVLPGDVIFMPVKSQNTSIWARISQITSIVSQVGLTAAALAVINR